MEVLRGYYHPGACCSCYTTSSKLQICGGCSVVKYCNKKCQKAHWKNHKQFCQFTTKIWEELFAIMKSNPMNVLEVAQEMESFLEIKFIEHHLPRLTNTRPPYSFLQDTRFFRTIMFKLFREGDRSNLTCPKCFNVLLSAPMNLDVQLHSEFCTKFQFINKCVVYAAQNTFQLPTLNNKSYVERTLEKDITTFAKLHIDCDIGKNIAKLGVYTEIISSPVSLLHAIKQIPKTYLEGSSDEFVIHIFGAWYNRELCEMDIWKHCFLRFLPQSRNVRLVFVGLHVKEEICESRYWVENGIFLETKYTFEILHMTYHDYVCSKYHVTPNLLALLVNSDNDLADCKLLWKLQLQIPLIIATKYTDTFISDLNLPSQRKVLISINCNPFSSLLPMRYDFLCSDIFILKELLTFLYLNKIIRVVVDK